MKTKKKDSFMDYIKANRRGSREAEIENHGHPVSFNRVHVSKKVYNRKRMKADDQRRLPYLFIGGRSLSFHCAVNFGFLSKCNFIKMAKYPIPESFVWIPVREAL